MSPKQRSTFLKVALFATGMSGIVAEYLLSTLATYFLGDATRQWTLIVSFMLFSMGLGARLSSGIRSQVLAWFLGIELLLSIVVGLSGSTVYLLAAHTVYLPVIIYSLCIVVGLLIGMEIPLVMRINESFDELRVNVSSVLENDYYGSLLGGLFFAFIAIPVLGLTYTPYVLAVVNFSVSIALSIALRGKNTSWVYYVASVATVIVLTIGALNAPDIVRFGEQTRYKDKVVYSAQSKYQSLVLTQWKDSYWLYLNGNLQFSTVDELAYHESLIVPALASAGAPSNVLIVGGGDGLAARSVRKLLPNAGITIVDLDPEVTSFAQSHPIMVALNDSILFDRKVRIVNEDAFAWLEKSHVMFDVIIVDLPDPRSLDLARLYSVEFYAMCHRHLSEFGTIVTQSSNPFLAPGVYSSVCASMQLAGFNTKAYREHLPTFGQWSWVLGATRPIEPTLKAMSESKLLDSTQWLTVEHLQRMLLFGESPADIEQGDSLVNTLSTPVLHTLYRDSRWDLH